MNNKINSTSQMLDIVLPQTPADTSDYSSLLILGICITLIVVGSLFILYRERLKYRLQISTLKKKLLSTEITPRQAAYSLAHILQSAHKTARLSAIYIEDSCQQPKGWQNFINQLSTYRYSANEVTQLDMINLIDDAKSWLKMKCHD